MPKSLALVGLNNSHPYVFSGLVNGGLRNVFTTNSPGWTHRLFPERDWEGQLGDNWRFTEAWARDMQFARRVAEATRVGRMAESLEQAAQSTDGAFVCDMWGDYHREQALPFLLRGKPVFVDKPLAETLADAEAMIEAAQAGRTVLSTCSAMRFDPALQELKKRLSGKPPRIVTVCCPCYQDLARYAVHGIEIMLEFMAGMRVRSVRNIGPSHRRHLLLLEFTDGACGVIHSWEDHAYSLTATGDSGQDAVRLAVEDNHARMVAAVLASFERGEPVRPYEEALEVVRVIEAGVASQLAGGRETRINGR